MIYSKESINCFGIFLFLGGFGEGGTGGRSGIEGWCAVLWVCAVVVFTFESLLEEGFVIEHVGVDWPESGREVGKLLVLIGCGREATGGFADVDNDDPEKLLEFAWVFVGLDLEGMFEETVVVDFGEEDVEEFDELETVEHEDNDEAEDKVWTSVAGGCGCDDSDNFV
jgi:hypothetical protein